MKKDSKRRLCINLVEKGRPYEISEECYAVFAAKKPDGKFIYNNCVIENNKIIYEITEQTTIAVGEMPCEIKLYGADDALISSPRFKIIVNKPVFDDEDENEIESSNEVTALTALISHATDLINEVETKLENGEFDGHDMTHEWIGTVLKVTSASGTSEADLRGPQGERGLQGIQGERGERGETGKGLVILGYYASVSELSAAVSSPAVGDAYGVGAGAPYNIYMWDGNKWVDNGQLQGAKGDEGDAATEWQLSMYMDKVEDGKVVASLYKNGELCTETKYLASYVSSGGGEWRAHGTSTGNITGSKSWSFGGTKSGMAWRADVYEDNTKEIFLTSGFVAIGPTGADGIQGPQGPQGSQGNPGKDGLTTSVNGVQQVNGNVTLTASDVGADPSGTATSAVSSHNGDSSAHSSLFAKKVSKRNTFAESGNVNITLADNTEYTFNAVTSLTFKGTINDNVHGFVTFGSSAPSISITGFNKSGGDDIASAKASEIWEFSCERGYIIWKNWSA